MQNPQNTCQVNAAKTLNISLRAANNIPNSVASAAASAAAYAIYFAQLKVCQNLPK
ncbi:hypothetical protein [Nostoc sp. FACHB-133]|uniref:hypothetical protein n=1 Tax=Nostoc sp. FACHB-133 TaxID=2692835 RepID=UPI00168398AF|nr:hypothetical protein [Nostoc sp. FACHB-133]MBD2520413.1 hypothetical protein [Nostoc sp. FACHB-973]MBD2526904.1 hypothetical protein [Nostoc sp. FACHB-133]